MMPYFLSLWENNKGKSSRAIKLEKQLWSTPPSLRAQTILLKTWAKIKKDFHLNSVQITMRKKTGDKSNIPRSDSNPPKTHTHKTKWNCNLIFQNELNILENDRH